MRRRAIEPDELFETAERLKAEGKDVSATALLDALGGGSLRTIYRLMEVWQQKRPTVPPATPAEIPGPVLASFGTAWRVAMQEAGREVEAVKAQAAEEVKAVEAKFQETLDAMEEVQKAAEAEGQKAEALTQRVADLEAQLHKSDSENAAKAATIEQLERQLKSQENERAERDKVMTEAAELRGMVEALKSHNADLLSKLSNKE